ncbi:DUF2892 family protein [Rhodovulum bhavnagarense]|uniref:DUF2892 family protein n=1 Tax=Rhodovulum bhavnagarense TaxID=992286 RepID=A0A4R2RVY3_9RHOB|nr:DUF2892 domain-containing protein [Rhodovulum bhavnagarense]TCP63295.1 DUF2892 family protein [Rhodovulum bhavnagarense]
MFEKNVGGIDRISRIIVGVGLIAGFFLNDSDSVLRYAYWLGVIPLATGVLATCPLYSIVGIKTCKTH